MKGTITQDWSAMSIQLKHRASELAKRDIPTSAGIYAWYFKGERIYVGKAANLRKRVGGNHLGQGTCLTGSAFRRNVAEYLGIATAADIKARRRTVSREEADRVCAFIADCEVAWITCGSEPDACCLEDALKQEYKPALTKV
jgi:excinuclease UvrABC nuclease subunit